MSQNNTATPDDKWMDISNCRAYLDGMGVAECLSVAHPCQWGVSHGNARLCRHPSARQIAASTKRQREQLA